MIRRSSLAILGGSRIREKPYPSWPRSYHIVEDVLFALWKSLLRPRTKAPKEADLVSRFEYAFAELHDGGTATAFRSGREAVRSAVLLLGLSSGDEVILPAYADPSVAAVVLETGAVPVFADIDPATLTLDPFCAELNVTRRTRAIVAFHFAGQPADMDRLMAVADRHGLSVLEDARHAPLARCGPHSVGTFGTVACFSFEASRNIAIGQGGLVFRHTAGVPEASTEAANALRFHPDKAPVLNHAARMTDEQALLGLAQLDRAELLAAVRERGASILSSVLAEVEGLTPISRAAYTTRHAYNLFVARYNPDAFRGLDRRRFLMALNAEGIPAQPGWPCPVYQLPDFTEHHPKNGAKAAEAACREAVWFPQNVLLANPDDIRDVARAVEKIREQADALLSRTDL